MPYVQIGVLVLIWVPVFLYLVFKKPPDIKEGGIGVAFCFFPKVISAIILTTIPLLLCCLIIGLGNKWFFVSIVVWLLILFMMRRWVEKITENIFKVT